jgi:predicted PurR-regulated permease PerM
MKESFFDRHSKFFVTAFVWTLLFAVVYVLRSFFLLMFLTFVFAYIQSEAVNRLAKRIANRGVRVWLVGMFFLFVIIVVFNLLIPQIGEQAKAFANNTGRYLKLFDSALIEFSDKNQFLKLVLPPLNDPHAADLDNWDPKHSPSANLLKPLFGLSFGEESESANVDSVKKTIDQVKGISAKVLAVSSSFLLSLLFSFLIVYDLPRLTMGAKSLANTKVGFIYEEAAESIYSFCGTLGKAFEAQFFVALLNTFLTLLGMLVIGIKGELLFLSMIVFLCSFIPIVGVFISSMPLCLLALEQGGVALVLIAILMVTVVHLAEAYVFNPRIFGQHLRMNPVIVMIILTMGGKLFGVWGLVLGLPICTYIYRQAIQYKPQI